MMLEIFTGISFIPKNLVFAIRKIAKLREVDEDGFWTQNRNYTPLKTKHYHHDS